MGTSLKTLIIFWRASLEYPWYLIGAMGAMVTGMSLQKLGIPVLVAAALGKLIEVHGQAGLDYWPIFLPYLITLAVVAVVAQTLNDLGLYFLTKLETAVRPALQMRIFDLLVNQSLNFHANNFAGSLVSQTQRFTAAYISLTDVFVINIVIMTIVSLFAIGVVAYYIPTVALAMLLWTIFFVWLNVVLTRKRILLVREASSAESVLTGHLADALGNVGAIKAFAGEQIEHKIHGIKNDDRAIKRYRAWILGNWNDLQFGILMALLQVTVLTLLIFMSMQSTVAFATLILVQIYVSQLIQQLWGLGSITRTIDQSLADASEMTELLGKEIEVKDPIAPDKLNVTQGGIKFNKVRFTHDGNNRALFNNFDLGVDPGKKIGLVGHSGSGKTSLTKLLLRFVDIQGGSINIDGQDISKVRQADLRSHIAYVPQEPLLFHRSLFENIAYGRPSASKKEIFKAAKQAHAHDFIKSLPKGYETMVGERGVKLSGGQRQRIAIARAILKDAPILVLDEATSALDSESEHLIQDALWKLMEGRTAIVIAHRLSTIQKMDRIVVMQEGKIVEQGTHKELLTKKGIYSDLWARQSGGFIEE